MHGDRHDRSKASLTYVRPAREGDRAALAVLPSPTPYVAPDNLGYVRVRGKFALAIGLSLAWLVFTIWIALPWMRELARLAGWPVSLMVVGGIAIVPGVMNAFLAA